VTASSFSVQGDNAGYKLRDELNYIRELSLSNIIINESNIFNYIVFIDAL
jgi:hypothetical protein